LFSRAPASDPFGASLSVYLIGVFGGLSLCIWLHKRLWVTGRGAHACHRAHLPGAVLKSKPVGIINTTMSLSLAFVVHKSCKPLWSSSTPSFTPITPLRITMCTNGHPSLTFACRHARVGRSSTATREQGHSGAVLMILATSTLSSRTPSPVMLINSLHRDSF